MGDTTDDYEKLFLLEVLVDNLYISNSNLNLDKSLLPDLADTCVLFQFLHYPPLVVCESDFIGSPLGRRDTSHITFKSGKSCFFSLRSPRRPILPVPFEIKVSVIRKLREGVLPDKLDIGKTCINMSCDFTELLSQNTEENSDTLPLSKNVKGTFQIQDESGKNVGSLNAFVRLSCFGKLIITQFSLNKEDEKSYLFKGTDVKNICQMGTEEQYPNKGFGIQNRQPLSPEARYPSMDEQRGFDNRVKEFARSQIPPQTEVDFYRPKTYPEDRPCGCPVDFSSRPPPPRPPAGRFSGRGNLCDCPYPVPLSVMSKYSQRAEKNLGLTPGEVGLQDDQVIFQLPLKRPGDPQTDRERAAQDSSVYYKLTSAEETEDGQQKNTVHIKSDDLPGMAGKGAVSPVSGLPVDDGHDVFLLKIGKKCDGDKKRNLELELRTPKMKEPKPPMTDQNTQYLESDIPKKEGSKDKCKKGGKGGKGKGGKGKKGKK